MFTSDLHLDSRSIYKKKHKKYRHCCAIITGRNEVVAKVIFLHVSVINSVRGEGVCLSACWDTPPGTRQTPPGPDPLQTRQTTPPGTRLTTPLDQADHPLPRDQADAPMTRQTTPPRDQADPPSDQADPPPGSRLQHTVNERPVRILLECILVMTCFLAIS